MGVFVTYLTGLNIEPGYWLRQFKRVAFKIIASQVAATGLRPNDQDDLNLSVTGFIAR